MKPTMADDLTIDPRLLVALDDLSLVAQGAVEGFLSGLHRSPFLGYSTEFASYRPYLQGDNLRYVDWKVWGRTDEFYVKQFEDDTNLNCEILLDTSASMDFGSPNKFQYGKVLTASIAYLMVRQHDAPGLTLFGERAAHALPPRSSRHHLDELFHLLGGTAAGGRTFVGEDLQGVVQTFIRRGLAVVISDFFASGETLFELLRQLHFQRQEVIAFQVLSPEELDFNYEGDYVMTDSETGEEIPVHAGEYRAEYQQRLVEFNRRVERECATYEFHLQQLRTDEPLDRALIAYLEQRTAL
jgi:uncharacterized protein (DUF58 family)